MLDTIGRYLQGIASRRDQQFLGNVINPIGDRMSSQPLTSAGLVISAGGATTAKIGTSDFYAVAKGVLVKVAASTAMPALTGVTFTTGRFIPVCFFVDSAGTVTMLGGTSGATLAGAKFPQFPVGKALIGFLIITYAGTFTGGTTPLDTATTVYVSPLGAFDPTVLL